MYCLDASYYTGYVVPGGFTMEGKYTIYKRKMNYYETDPEFMKIMEHFTGEEVVKEPGQELPEKTRYLAILAALLGCQGLDVYKDMLPKALDGGLTPVMAKEMVYLAVDYLGIGRVMPFLSATNAILTAREVELPLPAQGTTTMENRLEKGAEAQAEIFGESQSLPCL